MNKFYHLILACLPLFAFGQIGKDGISTVGSNTIVNEYTYLTSNVSAGSSSISVNSSSLNDNGRFSATLAPGDLVFIYQVQGASIDASTFGSAWGAVTNYNNAGNYEFAEVASVPNTNTITFRCGLQNSYTSAGHVQVIRVPRYEEVLVNAQISAPAWNGNTGGIVVLESENNVNFTASGVIDVSGLGFRGGVSEITNSYWGSGQFGSNDHDEGAAKGESIVGYVNEYNAINAERAQGAPANGGGGGNGHNAGGGGGSNGGAIANYTDGIGIPDPAYNTAWALESPSIAGATNSGGGRGGYTFSGSNQNPLSVAPGNSSWGSDNRRNVGGRGGRPMDYSTGKIFFGGGGGAGDMNNGLNYGGSGGNGGGLVFIRAYGDITGSGTINANGNDGVATTTSSAPAFGYAGEDGAGGAGAGGTIVLEAQGTVGAISCNATGGAGGDQILVPGSFYFGGINEAEGPGGGGSGGKIVHSGGTFTSDLSGGNGGTSNSASMTSFPYNGATGGADGDQLDISANLYTLSAENDTICAGNSTTLTAVVGGSLPGGTSIIWYDAPVNGNFIGAGTNFTTGNLSNDTTFYVGFCPGSYTIPVSVIMGTSFSFSTANVAISDENCGQADGSITGITVSGGAQPLQYEWNSILTVDQDLTGASAGSYTLVITDDNGCAANIGTFNIGENLGPVVDTTNMVVQDDQCSQGLGGITGIAVSGQSPFTYTWNSISSPSEDLSSAAGGFYDLEVTDAFGCATLIEDIEITNTTGPTIDTTAMTVADDHCGQGLGSITGITSTGATPFTYTWNGVSSTSEDVAGLTAGSYELIVIDTYGCADTISSVSVADISGPSIDTTSMTVTPESCDNADGAIAGIIVNGSSPFDYFWNGTSSALDASNLVSDNYTLVVEDAFGCSDSIVNISVGFNGYPTANFTYTPSDPYAGDTVTFLDESTGGNIVSSTFFLSDGTIVNDTIATEYFNDRGVYDICLVVENIHGCVDSVCNTVMVIPIAMTIEVPNIFTPNQDGTNDYFRIEGIEDQYSLQVFNRWGQVVFSESPYLNIWDGVATNGQELSGGTYYYILTPIEQTEELETYTGNVLLQR
jgi:gliding motility-associated-like protein